MPLMSEGVKATRGSSEAREWAAELAENFGKAVKLYRENLGLSAVQLSNRTKEQGYPITRATLAKIESNSRNAKVDVAEVFTLAAALEVSPRELLFPGKPSKRMRVTQRAEMSSEEAQLWFTGDFMYNEFGGLQRPKLTQTKMLDQALVNFRRATESLKERWGIEEGMFGYYVSRRIRGDGAHLDSVEERELQEEYKRIRGLHEAVLKYGGYVELPDWIDTFSPVPF